MINYVNKLTKDISVYDDGPLNRGPLKIPMKVSANTCAPS